MAEAATTKKSTAKKTASSKSAKGSASKKDLFAVIETGGKQYQVAEGEVITIEQIEDKNEGDKVTFDQVLLVDDGSNTSIGTPYLEKAAVEGTVEEAGKAEKVEVVRYKRKSRYLKRKGHRQPYMKVKIEKIK